jgi:uncharacterized OB-fold protein
MHPTAREYYRRLAQDAPATTRCPSCAGPAAFPPRARCGECAGPTEWVALPRRGRLEAFTTQETALRFGAPVALALARLGEAVVPGVIDAGCGELHVGDEVEVDLRPEPALGLTLVHYRSVGRGPG